MYRNTNSDSQASPVPVFLHRWQLLVFLAQSLPSILRKFGVNRQTLAVIISSLSQLGVRACLGRLVTVAASLRAEDPSLYRRWIAKVENPHATRATYPTAAVVIVGWRSLDQLHRSVESLQAVKWVCQILIVNAPDDLVAYQLKDLSDASDALHPLATGLIVLAAPALVAPACSLPQSGLVSAVFDHDQWRDGQRSSPSFKPGVTRELFQNTNYNCVVYLTRSDLMNSKNAMTANVDVARFLLLAKRVVHHPVVAVSFLEAPLPRTDAVVAIDDSPDPCSVSVLIPTRDRLELIQPCVETLLRDNSAQIELIILDNGSADPATLAWLQAQEQLGAVRVLRCDYPFNWSKLNNDGARVANGEVLIFLNNDTESIEHDWINRLCAEALKEDTGCVGPMLLYPDGRIQHAGIVVGYGGFADHVFVGQPPETQSVFVAPTLTRQVAAVTGACLAIRKALFDQFQGMNEQLQVAGDLELCLRLHGAGYRNVYRADTRLIHKESKTRTKGLPATDRLVVSRVIEEVMPQGDPFFNPNLSLHSLFPLPRF